MRGSEFRRCMELAFGPERAQSVQVDLFLPQLGGSAQEALARGWEYQAVWQEVRRESGLPAEFDYLHRFDLRSLQQLARQGLIAAPVRV